MKLPTIVLSTLVAVTLGLHPQIARRQQNHSPFYLDPAAFNGTDTAVAAPPDDSPPPPATVPDVSLPPSAGDDMWENCRCKGENFLKAMCGSDKEAGSLFRPSRETAASEFSTTADLRKWGWANSRVEGPALDFKNWGVDDTLRNLGSSGVARKLGGTILVVAWDHGDLELDMTERYHMICKCTKTTRATGARYVFGMDPGESGSKMHGNHMPWKALTTTQVLIAMDRESPRYAGKDREPKVEGSGLPDLQSFSDVAWIYWNGLSKDPTKIRHFLSVVISNSDTQGIIGRAMRNVNSLAMTPWPGKEFSADSDNGKALLGSPNAVAFSYFLIQHKATLGNLQITKIQVFHGNEGHPGLAMVFYVEAVPSENVGEGADNTNMLKDSRDSRTLERRLFRKYRL